MLGVRSACFCSFLTAGFSRVNDPPEHPDSPKCASAAPNATLPLVLSNDFQGPQSNTLAQSYERSSHCHNAAKNTVILGTSKCKFIAVLSFTAYPCLSATRSSVELFIITMLLSIRAHSSGNLTVPIEIGVPVPTMSETSYHPHSNTVLTLSPCAIHHPSMSAWSSVESRKHNRRRRTEETGRQTEMRRWCLK